MIANLLPMESMSSTYHDSVSFLETPDLEGGGRLPLLGVSPLTVDRGCSVPQCPSNGIAVDALAGQWDLDSVNTEH